MTDAILRAATLAQRSPSVTIHPDLASAWTAERAVSADADPEHLPHPEDRDHGWLQECGAIDALAPVLPGPVGLDGGTVGFRDLGGSVAARLLEVLPPAVLTQERQNWGPSLDRVLRSVAAHPEDLVAHGYLVSPRRCDERLSVEGVLVRAPQVVRVYGEHDDGCQCQELLGYATALGVDDAVCDPHEITPWYKPVRSGPEGGGWWRLWWD